jgi:predicted ester cyclase
MTDARQVAAEFVEAFNAHDEARLRSLNAENAVFEAPGEIHLEGRDATTDYAMGWLNAFPDARLTVTNEVGNGDWIAQEFTFEGRHDDTLHSPGGDIPATHRQLRGRGVQILRIEGTTIADTRLYFDQVQVMTQLGLMPDAVAAG